MKISSAFLVLLLLFCPILFAAGEDAFYKLGPDSLPQSGVPHGTLLGPTTLPSNAFPGYGHTYWIYVPAQYDSSPLDSSQPAGLMIFNDGQAMLDPRGDVRAMNVLDNLTWRREIPVLISVFIDPGKTPQTPEPNEREWGDHTTLRPEEYNTVFNKDGTPYDKYTHVISDELLPIIKSQYNISADPDMHAIAGASSGAIAAFTVAWQRPDEFHKVISIVGSFTNIRGGDVYPEEILATDKKPIRIFLQDGVNDNRALTANGYNPRMDWHYQNVRLLDALTKKGYDVNFTWGIGLHGQHQGGAILPEMMRWLWRDYPRDADPHDMSERSFRGAATRTGE